MSNHSPTGNPVRSRVGGKAPLAILLPLALAAVVLGGDLELSRSTIDGGGIMFSTGGDFELSGTTGQPDAGVMSNGSFALTGGFWFQQVPGDCNGDGGVDLFDYATFEACMSGPDGGLSEPACVCFDLDVDGDVDLQDACEFQRAFSG